MILLKNRDRNPSFKKGEYVEINDAGNYPMKLSVDGVCKQNTTTGKNLFDYVNNLKASSDGLTSVINDDGSITTTGKPSTDYRVLINPIDITDILEDGQIYTISQSNLSNKLYIQVSAKKADGTSTYYYLLNKLSQQINVDKSVYVSYNLIISTGLLKNWGDTSSTITNKYMLCKGTDTADTSFEPYTGGQPSPNPDYPQSISTIENSLKITSCNKNLFDMDYVKGSMYGSYTITNDIITFIPSETSAHSRIIILIPKDKFIVGQKYTIKANGCNRIAVGYSTSVNDTSNYIYFVNKSNVNNASFTYSDIPTDYVCIYLYNTKSTLGTNWTLSEIQLEKNSTATEYEQHLETQITANLPEGEFIGKINDTYKDTLKVKYIKEDGHYHLILNKMVGKVVLDGSADEIWSAQLTNASGKSRFRLDASKFNMKTVSKINEIGKIISTCFLPVSVERTWFNYNGIAVDTSKYIFIYSEETSNLSLTDFKSWLLTHNVEVYYALATPYEVELGIVDTLLSYDEITNIFTDSDLYPVINAKYYKDFEFDKILRSGYNIDEQEYEIAKKQMANGKRKRILSSYDDCIIKINLGLLDNKTYQEYKEQLDDGEFHYWSYKYNQYKKANFILTKPSITTEYAYDDDIGINDMEITLEKSSDIE